MTVGTSTAALLALAALTTPATGSALGGLVGTVVPQRGPGDRAAVLRGGQAEQAETHEFKAEITQLMSLIINAFYSNKEVFLRELISNAADAIEKIRHQSLTDPNALAADPEMVISLVPDVEAKTLTVIDSGIGMTKAELVANLGTVARSGTKAFMQALQSGQTDTALIGQFGVGFYSAFLVARTVKVYSKHNDEASVHSWESDAGGSYTVGPAQYDGLERGTAIVLTLHEEHADLLEVERLAELVSRHSEFVPHPIRVLAPKPPPPPATPAAAGEGLAAEGGDAAEGDAASAAREGSVAVEDVSVGEVGGGSAAGDGGAGSEWRVLNEQPPIWMQPAAELSEEQYHSFYRRLTGDWEPPLAHSHFAVEGQIGLRGLLYVPRRAPVDLFEKEPAASRLKLYVRRVFVMDGCEEICPEWLSFLRGVVDSDDLPLNVSREMLQQSTKLMRLLRKNIVRKALALLAELAADEERYATFYASFSKQLKLGIHEDAASREKLAPLLRFPSTATDGANATSLGDYVSRLAPGQEDIYYLAAESVEAARASPFLEAYARRGLEVLFMVDPIDEYALQALPRFEGRRLLCVTKGDFKLPPLNATDGADADGARPSDEAMSRLCGAAAGVLGDRVDGVVVSARLGTSPCVLVTAEFGWSANMERIMRAQAMRDPSMAQLMAARKTLELNPDNEIVRCLAARAPEAGVQPPVAFADTLTLLYQAALVDSGFAIDEPAGFTGRIHALLARELARDGEVR